MSTKELSAFYLLDMQNTTFLYPVLLMEGFLQCSKVQSGMRVLLLPIARDKDCSMLLHRNSSIIAPVEDLAL